MHKTEFLEALQKRLCDLPKADAAASLAYYSEMIEDRMEDGLSEEEAVAVLGSVDAIASEILCDQPLSQIVRTRIQKKHALRAWEIVLLTLGAPLWIPLLIAAAAVVLSVYLVLWSVVASLYAVDLSLALCAIAGVLAVAFIPGAVLSACFAALGGGFVCAGLSVLLFLAANCAAKGCVWIAKQFLRALKRSVIRKEYAE